VSCPKSLYCQKNTLVLLGVNNVRREQNEAEEFYKGANNIHFMRTNSKYPQPFCAGFESMLTTLIEVKYNESH